MMNYLFLTSIRRPYAIFPPCALAVGIITLAQALKYLATIVVFTIDCSRLKEDLVGHSIPPFDNRSPPFLNAHQKPPVQANKRRISIGPQK
jgi:hypothetical protein